MAHIANVNIHCKTSTYTTEQNSEQWYKAVNSGYKAVNSGTMQLIVVQYIYEYICKSVKVNMLINYCNNI